MNGDPGANSNAAAQANTNAAGANGTQDNQGANGAANANAGANNAAAAAGAGAGDQNTAANANANQNAANQNAAEMQVPADGKYNFGLGEGEQIDQTLADTFTAVGAKYKIPAGAAKELATAYKAARQQEAANFKAEIDKQVNAWAEETEKDPEIGGAKLQENLGLVNRALGAYDKAGELRNLLNVSGMGNHKTVVKFLMQVGKTVAEDPMAMGSDGQGEKSLGQIFYPKGTM